MLCEVGELARVNGAVLSFPKRDNAVSTPGNEVKGEKEKRRYPTNEKETQGIYSRKLGI